MQIERKKLVTKLDRLCRQILLIRDQYLKGFFKCISRGRILPINRAQVGHFISRRYESVRWDFRNISLQCSSCNGPYGKGNLIEYRKSLVKKIGKAEVERMELFYRETPHYSAFDLLQKVKEYQEILKEYH